MSRPSAGSRRSATWCATEHSVGAYYAHDPPAIVHCVVHYLGHCSRTLFTNIVHGRCSKKKKEKKGKKYKLTPGIWGVTIYGKKIVLEKLRAFSFGLYDTTIIDPWDLGCHNLWEKDCCRKAPSILLWVI